MKEMTFRTVGILPVTDTRWHIREGGGHVWFVNENPDVTPYALANGVFVALADGLERTDVPLVMPKVDA